MRASVLFRSALLPALGVAAVLAGCDSTTEPNKNPPPPAYPVLSSPQNVLMALALAYEREDTLETKAVYDPSYVGTSLDMTGGSAGMAFRYSDEVAHVAALARNPLVTVLDFYISGALTRLPSDDLSHPEWAVIQISGSNFGISVFDQSSNNTYEATGSNETFEFAFRPTPDSPSPTDTLWKCVRWKETRSF